MNWEKAILKIDVVKDSNCIIREIDGISRKCIEGIGDIDDLIAKYKDDENHLGFIKGYAETQLAANSIKLAITAFMLALISILISLGSIIIAVIFTHKIPDAVLSIGYITLIIFVAIVVGFVVVIYFELGPYEDLHIN